ncbi:MAG: glucosaminidase domain-containing protein [Bacteroidota bacterium]
MRSAARERVVSIDWSLLFRRIRRRIAQLFSSAKHKAAQTEYTPPVWLTSFRLSWFRLGLIALFLYVFTQKQIDFNFSVGKEGLFAGGATSEQTVTTAALTSNQMSIIPVSTTQATSTSAGSWSVDQLNRPNVEAYVERFERVARTEAEKYGIPIAGKLAMAIYESQAGTSPVAQENNNHFGAATPNGYYPNAWTNWRSHSEFLKHDFPQLTNQANNLEGWLASLSRSSYQANATEYTDRLRSIIQAFNLDRY